MNTPLKSALGYIERGIAVVPIPHGEKGPIIAGWRELRINADTAARYFNGEPMNIGGLMGEPSGDLTDLDLDCDEARLAAASFLPSTGSVSGREGNPSSHYFYISPGAASARFVDPEANDMLLEVRSTGCQTVLPGSTHTSGEAVRWYRDDTPAAVDAGELARAAGRLAAATLLLRLAPDKGRHPLLWGVGNVLAARLDRDAALAFLEPLARLMRRGEVGNHAAEARRIVDNAVKRREEGKPVPGWWKLVEGLGRKRAVAVSQWLGIEFGGGDGGGLSHDALALEFSGEMDGDARYVDVWGKWLFHSEAERAWREDEVLLHEAHGRGFLRCKAEGLVKAAAKRLAEAEAAAKALHETDDAAKRAAEEVKAAGKRVAWAAAKEEALRSSPMLKNVLAMAVSNDDVRATVDMWDRDPWLLGTPGGTVDLRTGRLRDARREDYITKRCGVAPADPGTPAPVWDAFLARIFRHDPELVGFTERFYGYCLTGRTTEHQLVFNWGQGGNGKTVLLGVVGGVLGDYVGVLPTAQLMAHYNEPHPTTIAALRGVRLVTAQEVPPGKFWDETKLKELTGGDKLKARFMHQDEFEYTPQFKIAISGNNKPSFRRVDEAIKRRINLVPFLQNLPREERDTSLPDKLKAEWPAILRRLIDGCLEWQRGGLRVPEIVRAASAAYLDSEDVIMLWFEERCVRDPETKFTKLSFLWESYRAWREAAGMRPVDTRAMARELEEKGFSTEVRNVGKVVLRVRLKTEGEREREEAEPDPDPRPVFGPKGEDGEDGKSTLTVGEQMVEGEYPLAPQGLTELKTVHGEASEDSEAVSERFFWKKENQKVQYIAHMGAPSPSSPSSPFCPVASAEAARRAVAELAGKRGGLVGLDLETTGLDPLTAEPRLLQLAPADGPVTIIDLFQAGGLAAVAGPLAELRTVAHNAVFDMGFLRHAGVRIVPECTMLAGHVLTGKAEKLSVLAERHLGLHLDKGGQKSDWSGDLSEEQLRYAALDAAAVRDLMPALRAALDADGGARAYELMRDAQPAVVAMRLAGMPFDAAAQAGLVERLTAERDRLAAALGDALAGRNPGSGAQLSDWLAGCLGGDGLAAWPKTGTGKALATGADTLRKGLSLLPDDKALVVRELLLPYKVVAKRLSAFGANLAGHISPKTGRIHADFRIAATVAGRMSCSGPNLQQIPRDPEYRSLFKAPEGRAFVIADYGQAELRVAAMLAGEERLLAAFRDGLDTHALTAGMLLGKPAAEVTKAERQLAKAVNFGLLYGQGATGLQAYASNSYGVEITEDEARRHRRAWFAAYPAFRRWHDETDRESRKALSVRTTAGRVRRWPNARRADPACWKLTEALNTPVQGGAAEAMLAALGHLAERLDGAGIDAFPIAVVHDEVIVEAAEGDAAQAARLLEESMVDGMLDLFPDATTTGLVEAHVGKSWADK